MGTEGFSFWFLHWTPTNYRASPVLRLNSEIIYWVGQKVHTDFFCKLLQKTPNKLFDQPNSCVVTFTNICPYSDNTEMEKKYVVKCKLLKHLDRELYTF